jgi:hypothetical protein
MTSNDEIFELLARWDRQQEGYIRQREERFEVMFEVLETAFGKTFTIIDAAKVIAVDADVMLLEIARTSLASDSDRVRVVQADLSRSSWDSKVLEALEDLKADRPCALVSTTALHWLLPGELAEFYGAAGALLKPGGIVMNGDHMRFDSRWPTLAEVAKSVRQRIEREAVANGEDDWAAWWKRAGAIPRLAELKARRDAFFSAQKPKRATSAEDCSVDFHVAALRHAGFSEAGTAWQQLDNYVVFGRLPI